MTVYKSLEDAMKALEGSLQTLQTTMAEVRTSLRNDSEQRTRRTTTANLILWRHGYMEESESKLEQWGVYDAPTDDAAEAIIYEAIEYRKDATLHHCGE